MWLLIGAISVLPTLAAAALPPAWPMYGQNPRHSRAQAAASNLLIINTTTTFLHRSSSSWVYGAPAVGGNETLYYSSWDGHMYAVHAADGTAKWSFRCGTGKIWSSPALSADEGTVYIGANNSLLAVSQTAAGPPVLRWAVRTKEPVFASPTLDEHGVVYIGGLDGTMRAVAPNGTLLWAYASKGGPIYASAAVSDDSVFFSTLELGHIFALSRADGSLRWDTRVSLAPIPSSPVRYASRDAQTSTSDRAPHLIITINTRATQHSAEYHQAPLLFPSVAHLQPSISFLTPTDRRSPITARAFPVTGKRCTPRAPTASFAPCRRQMVLSCGR